MIDKDVGSILDCISQAIFDKKGANILALDVRFSSVLADYVIIAEGAIDRHVIALAENIIQVLRKKDLFFTFVQGLQTGDWIVLDFSWIVVHLFIPQLREKYHLEGLWPDAEIIDVTINT